MNASPCKQPDVANATTLLGFKGVAIPTLQSWKGCLTTGWFHWLTWIIKIVSFFSPSLQRAGDHLPSAYWSLWAKKTSKETRSCWFSPLWMWLWGANPWAHSSDLPTPGDSTPTVLARRHWSEHQALGASCRTTADGGLPSSHPPEDLAQSSHRTQKKKKKGQGGGGGGEVSKLLQMCPKVRKFPCQLQLGQVVWGLFYLAHGSGCCWQVGGCPR